MLSETRVLGLCAAVKVYNIKNISYTTKEKWIFFPDISLIFFHSSCVSHGIKLCLGN